MTMYVDEMSVRRHAAQSLFVSRQRWRPLSHQIPPEGNWYGWLLNAGRGSGKTDACAQYVVDHVNGPPCLPGPIPHWISVIAPTQGDAVTSCYAGPSGIRAHDPSAKMTTGPGGTAIKWPNGSEAKLFGAHTPDEVERLRSGGNRCLAWLEELAAWRHLDDCWDHMRFGLRVGPRPHFVASTTPKPRKLIKDLVNGIIRHVVVTRGTMYDNPYLPAHIKEALEERYGGTSRGAQELLGELIEQDENALWQREWLDEHRIELANLPDLARMSVGVDPSGGAGEQGIVVVGKQKLVLPREAGKAPKQELHGFVLDDRSCRLSPDGWGRRAVQAAVDHEADDIVVETNYGGDMAVAVIRGAADAMGVNIPIKVVTASRGKRVRAEPVSALAARGRWHHVGRFETLEDQLCTWTPEADYSPDRLDAMVWPPWHFKLVGIAPAQTGGSFGGRRMSSTKLN